VLTPLQERIAVLVAASLEGSDFALAGGAALISQGLVDRKTGDLDFFGSSEQVLADRLPAIISALEQDGMTVEVRRSTAQFARIVIRGMQSESEVDLGLDGRLFPLEQGPFSPVLARRELAVDKVLAVFGRAEARDFVDLFALEQFFKLEDLFALAKEKDRGFDAKVFAEMTRRVTVFDASEFDMAESDFLSLIEAVERWRQFALALAKEQERGLRFER
jgi:hypothetical protein